MSARTIMIQGTASSVGKSLLTTALCRIWARRGLRVAPFKAQNMSLNSAVTPGGGEIGRAQLAQAEAARVRPHVDMNPILLKPETDSASQVVVLGRAIGSMHFADYQRRKLELRQVVGDALDRLRASHDLVVIEGAGSPAEVNLKAGDLVNMWVAERADAPVILVTDIERGGALAAVVGTLELLEPAERARVRALVVNKFRGDPSLFTDGVTFLEQRTAIRVAGVVPHLGDTRIASEDSLELERTRGGDGARTIAIAKLPHLSNFDEFEPLMRQPSLRVQWVERPSELADAALVIVPGTKCTVADLRWLRTSGLAGALVARAAAGGAILGVCGGYQMLGERIFDPDGVESAEPEVAGLGLLPVVTRFRRDKRTQPVRLLLGDGLPLLDAAGGREIDGYEIHCGRVDRHGARPFGVIVRRGDQRLQREPEGAVAGSVAGTLVHGLFESAEVRAALGAGGSLTDDPYDTLADHFAAALDLRHLDALIGL
jgi:adenosylcobyric acid synthase